MPFLSAPQSSTQRQRGANVHYTVRDLGYHYAWQKDRLWAVYDSKNQSKITVCLKKNRKFSQVKQAA